MQNNVVKRPICAFILAVLTALWLLFTLYEPNNEKVYTVKEIEKSDLPMSETGSVKLFGNGFAVAEYTKTVKRGSKAKITLDAPSGTSVDICAYYASGKSNSKVFTEKISENGTVSWEWTIPKSSKSDNVRIVLRSNDTYATLNITVI